MLSTAEIKTFIDEDYQSHKKRFARTGQRYYDSDHDIKQYRLFYYDADGKLQEDKSRSNVKIPHPFFQEIVDQATQYILSGKGGFVKSDDPQLQTALDEYFNNDDFRAELYELLTGVMARGFGHMYAYTTEQGRTAFQAADSLGVVEAEAKYTDDKKAYIIYWYIDRIDRKNNKIKRIEVVNEEGTTFFMQKNDGRIIVDECYNGTNYRPHKTYQKDDGIYYEPLGYIPFFGIDNNKKQVSDLKAIKGIIDDYDLMASSLSNNLIDFDTPIHVVKGFEGDNLDELQQNLKTKKIIGMESTDAGAGVDIKTVDVPYQARLTKLELDEKNIYKFGFAVNTAGLKDTSATTNLAIKAAYLLLDLKCNKLEIKLKQMLKKLIKVVLDEINGQNKTDYQLKDVYIEFARELPTNTQENAQNALTEAQEQQTRITTLLNLASQLDNDTLMQNICDVLDIDYEEIKGKLPDPDEADNDLEKAKWTLKGAGIVE